MQEQVNEANEQDFDTAFRNYINSLNDDERLSPSRLENEPFPIYKARQKLIARVIKQRKSGTLKHVSKLYWKEGEPETKTNGEGSIVNLRHPLSRQGKTFKYMTYDELIKAAKPLEDYVIDNEARLKGYSDAYMGWEEVALKIIRRLEKEEKNDECSLLRRKRDELSAKLNATRKHLEQLQEAK